MCPPPPRHSASCTYYSRRSLGSPQGPGNLFFLLLQQARGKDVMCVHIAHPQGSSLHSVLSDTHASSTDQVPSTPRQSLGAS